MSLQSLQSFRQQANGNPELEAAVRGCLSGPQGALDLGALAALGKRHGFDFSADDVRAAMATSEEELSDFELEVVSAGLPCNTGGAESGWG
ncbi:MAG: Nif11-like leader peptide family RiPP precursor [Betaproteobacteria bacterium]